MAMKYFLAELRDVRSDPTKSGRVKIRVYGKHDDEQAASDGALQWALPLQPVTSAATGKMGTSPTGMVEGSRVFGFYMDEACQHPVILGSFARAGSGNGGGALSDVKTANSDITQAARGVSLKGTQSKTLSPNTRIDFTKIPAYNAAPFQKDEGTEYHSESRKRYLPKAKDLPTTAKHSKKDLNPGMHILDQIMKVDKEGKSSAMPAAANNFKQILSVGKDTAASSGVANATGKGLGGLLQGQAGQMGLGNIMGMMKGMMGGGGGGGGAAGGGGGGGSGSGSSSQSNTASYDPRSANSVASVFADMLNAFGGYSTATDIVAATDPDSAQAIYAGLLSLLDEATTTLDVKPLPTRVYYGEVLPPNAIQPAVLMPRAAANTISTVGQIVETPPDEYFEVFSFEDVDPYPGYVLWEGPAGELVFSPRPIDEPYTGDPDQAIVDAAMAAMIVDLVALLKTGKITIEELVAILTKGTAAAKKKQDKQGQGNNPQQAGGGGGGGSNILGQLMKMLGKAKDMHIPNSVLKKDSVSKSLEKYQKRQTEGARVQKLAKTAVDKKVDGGAPPSTSADPKAVKAAADAAGTAPPMSSMLAYNAPAPGLATAVVNSSGVYYNPTQPVGTGSVTGGFSVQGGVG